MVNFKNVTKKNNFNKLKSKDEKKKIFPWNLYSIKDKYDFCSFELI